MEIAIRNERVTRMATKRLAALGANAASNNTIRQKKAAKRRKVDISRILSKSYADGLLAQPISQ